MGVNLHVQEITAWSRSSKPKIGNSRFSSGTPVCASTHDWVPWLYLLITLLSFHVCLPSPPSTRGFVA